MGQAPTESSDPRQGSTGGPGAPCRTLASPGWTTGMDWPSRRPTFSCVGCSRNRRAASFVPQSGLLEPLIFSISGGYSYITAKCRKKYRTTYLYLFGDENVLTRSTRNMSSSSPPAGNIITSYHHIQPGKRSELVRETYTTVVRSIPQRVPRAFLE